MPIKYGPVASGIDPSDATAETSHILSPETAYIATGKETGTMPNNADADVEITDLDGTTIPAGYYNGSGAAKLSAAEAAKVIGGNIVSGVTILGVPGTYVPPTPEKFITPTLTIPAPPTVSVSTAVAAI